MAKMDATILLRLPKYIKERLEKLSEREGRTVADLIREAISVLLRKKEKK